MSTFAIIFRKTFSNTRLLVKLQLLLSSHFLLIDHKEQDQLLSIRMVISPLFKILLLLMADSCNSSSKRWWKLEKWGILSHEGLRKWLFAPEHYSKKFHLSSRNNFWSILWCWNNSDWLFWSFLATPIGHKTNEKLVALHALLCRDLPHFIFHNSTRLQQSKHNPCIVVTNKVAWCIILYNSSIY